MLTGWHIVVLGVAVGFLIGMYLHVYLSLTYQKQSQWVDIVYTIVLCTLLNWLSLLVVAGILFYLWTSDTVYGEDNDDDRRHRRDNDDLPPPTRGPDCGYPQDDKETPKGNALLARISALLSAFLSPDTPS